MLLCGLNCGGQGYRCLALERGERCPRSRHASINIYNESARVVNADVTELVPEYRTVFRRDISRQVSPIA